MSLSFLNLIRRENYKILSDGKLTVSIYTFLCLDWREIFVRDNTETRGSGGILLRRRRRTVYGVVQRTFRNRHGILSVGGGQFQNDTKRHHVHDAGRPVCDHHKGCADGRAVFESMPRELNRFSCTSHVQLCLTELHGHKKRIKRDNVVRSFFKDILRVRGVRRERESSCIELNRVRGQFQQNVKGKIIVHSTVL